MRVHVISDMEGVAGIVKWQQTSGGDPMYEEGRRLYTEEINAAVRGAKAAGATEIVVMDCHGAGGGWTFNSLVPDLLDPDCEFVVQEEWTSYTGFLEAGCDAALFVGMHAMNGDAVRSAQPHGLGTGVAEPLLQRDARRRDGHQCSALRHVGSTGAARHGRQRDVRRGKGTARRRPDHGRGEGRPRPLQRAPVPRRTRARDDRGRARSERSAISKPCRRTTPAARARSRSSTR